MTTRFDLGHDDITYHVIPINTTAQTDSSHFHDPYRYASGILGKESSCGLKRKGATILRVVLTSPYSDWSLSLWYLSVLLLLIYLKPKTHLDKENTTK